MCAIISNYVHIIYFLITWDLRFKDELLSTVKTFCSMPQEKCSSASATNSIVCVMAYLHYESGIFNVNISTWKSSFASLIFSILEIELVCMGQSLWCCDSPRGWLGWNWLMQKSLKSLWGKWSENTFLWCPVSVAGQEAAEEANRRGVWRWPLQWPACVDCGRQRHRVRGESE